MGDRRVCLITGGSSGIGLATAIEFVKAGWDVAVCGRDRTRLEAAGTRLAESTSEVALVVADISSPEQAVGFVREAHNRLDRIDALVNNAGIAPLAPVAEMTDESFDSLIDINVRGVFRTTKAAWPVLQAGGGGVIVNVSSMAAVDPFSGFAAYGGTKAFVETFTRALADEGAPVGIRAYCVRPGAVETPLLRSLFPDFPGEQTADPKDVATVILSLCEGRAAVAPGDAVEVRRS